LDCCLDHNNFQIKASNSFYFVGKPLIFSGETIYILFAFIVTIFTNLYLLTSDNPSYILGASTLIVILIVLFYMSFRRDESVD
jgi:hypothetical protein